MAVVCEQFSWCGEVCGGDEVSGGGSSYWPSRGRPDAVCWSCVVNVIGRTRRVSRAALAQNFGKGNLNGDDDHDNDNGEEEEEEERYERAKWGTSARECEPSESKREYVAKVRICMHTHSYTHKLVKMTTHPRGLTRVCNNTDEKQYIMRGNV